MSFLEKSICAGSKRTVLVIEDDSINRIILSSVLGNEYEILTAENGKEGYEILSSNYRNISLIILDIYMPVMDGFEFLKKVSKDDLLSSVPVIVATSSDKQEDEVKCLKLGASDFIIKPYNRDVVLGRVHSIIKLKESVAMLSVVEFDQLTGLYTMSAFNHHATELFNLNSEKSFDLILLDIREFKLINSILGVKRGDEVLRNVAQLLRLYLPDAVIARKDDNFFVLCENGDRVNAETTRKLIDDFEKNAVLPNIDFKFGIYKNVDRNLSVQLLCDRVVMTIAGIKNDSTMWFAEYDEKIEAELIHNQKLESAFDEAINNGEFVVWYQPKVDIPSGKIVGAEALVRWRNKEGKMLPPAEFIPLFENDGLVSRLDEYVFEKVCFLLRDSIRAGRRVIPISVNISRNSIYRGRTAENYIRIVNETGVDKKLVPLEITESAATEGARICELTNQLKEEGFILHMDDFGKGYSSLSCLTTMPFDEIKLDKSIIDKIGSTKGNTVIRHMISIAQEMGMEVVAEGVETSEQAEFLKENRCDMIQGFLYYQPMSETDFIRTVYD